MLTDEVNFPAPKFSWLFAEPHPLRLPAAIATLDAAALLKKVLRLNLRFIQSSSHIAIDDVFCNASRETFLSLPTLSPQMKLFRSTAMHCDGVAAGGSSIRLRYPKEISP